jgi:hypothetical protein
VSIIIVRDIFWRSFFFFEFGHASFWKDSGICKSTIKTRFDKTCTLCVCIAFLHKTVHARSILRTA